MKHKANPLFPIRLIVFASLVLSLTGCGAGTKEVNLSNYIVFNATGYDTYGTAECWFDEEAYIKDIDAIFAEKDIWNEKNILLLSWTRTAA